MPQQTPTNLTVPTVSDTPDVPRDMLELATDVEPLLVHRFSTAAQRDTAKATRDFRECITAGERQIWNPSSSSWIPWPGHWISRGPTSITDYSSTSTVVCSVTVPMVLGRRYRIEGMILANQITASGQPTVYLATGTSIASRISMLINGNQTFANGDNAGGNAFAYVTPSATGNVTYNLLVAQTGGALRVGTNAAAICAIDIGAT